MMTRFVNDVDKRRTSAFKSGCIFSVACCTPRVKGGFAKHRQGTEFAWLFDLDNRGGRSSWRIACSGLSYRKISQNQQGANNDYDANQDLTRIFHITLLIPLMVLGQGRYPATIRPANLPRMRKTRTASRIGLARQLATFSVVGDGFVS